jgi:hypothetical protein
VPQVTKLENQLLSRIAKSGLWLSFVKGAAVYGIGRKKLEARDRKRAQRLIEHGYLVPHSRGLFPGGPDQTWTVRPQTDPPSLPPNTGPYPCLLKDQRSQSYGRQKK